MFIWKIPLREFRGDEPGVLCLFNLQICTLIVKGNCQHYDCNKNSKNMESSEFMCDKAE